MFAFFSRPGTSSLLNTKNELLRVTVTIRGTGHREVAFAVGELGPGFGNHPPYWGPATVWVPAGGCGPAPEPGARSVGTARQAAGAGSADRAERDMDLRTGGGRSAATVPQATAGRASQARSERSTRPP